MLRTITFNGLVERSITPRGTSSVRSATRRHLGSLSSTQTCSLPLSRHARLLSTPIPESKSSTHPTAEPTTLAPRKSRIDLKPAPIKPSASCSGSSQPHIDAFQTKSSKASSSKPSEPIHPTPDALEPSPDASSSFSITGGLRQAKLDIQKAQQQGVLAPPPPGIGRIKKLIHQARELFKFYWNGLKLINTHRIEVAAIRARVNEGGAPLSRAEYRFIRTYKEDALKLVPFIIIVLILEEVIPLIALYAPRMLPSTTIFPSQLKRIEDKAIAKQLVWAERRDAFTQVVNASHLIWSNASIKGVDLQSLRSLGSTPLASILGILRLPTWGPAPLLLWRLDQHLKFISEDDALLAKEDKGQRLTEGEVGRALGERSIVTTQLNAEEARRKLDWWLSLTTGSAPEVESTGVAVARRIYAVAKANA